MVVPKETLLTSQVKRNYRMNHQKKVRVSYQRGCLTITNIIHAMDHYEVEQAFVTSFQVAQNLLKLGMLTLLTWKNAPVLVFPQGFTHFHESPPPPSPACHPPPPFKVGNGITHTQCLFFKDRNPALFGDWESEWGEGQCREGWERGVDFHAGLSIFFSLLKKKHRDLFTRKELALQISVDSEQLGQLRRSACICFSCTEPFNFYLRYIYIVWVISIHWKYFTLCIFSPVHRVDWGGAHRVSGEEWTGRISGLTGILKNRTILSLVPLLCSEQIEPVLQVTLPCIPSLSPCIWLDYFVTWTCTVLYRV